jgi:hypothetical protein
MTITTPRRPSDGGTGPISGPTSGTNATSAAALGLATAVAAVGAALLGTARAQVAGGTPAVPFVTPSVLPATGTGGYRLGDLRDQVSSLLASGPLPFAGPAWIVTPSLSVDAGVDDNALEVSSPRRADVFTDITPSITITGDTSRLKVNASYSPVVTLFAQTPVRNMVSQYLNGDAFATVVPDLFYMDLRANITQSSITGGYGGYGGYAAIGGYGPSGSPTLNGQDQVQTSSLSFTPYLVHRFDGWGTGTLSYSLAYTAQSGYGPAGNVGTNGTTIPYSTGPYSGYGVNTGFLANQVLITNSEIAQFTTGENLGRTNLTAAVNLQQFSGNGIFGGSGLLGSTGIVNGNGAVTGVGSSGGASYNNLYTVSGTYALTRSVALIGEIGYQNLRFASVPVVEVNSPVWQAGVTLTPNPDSKLTVSYGRQDGIDSAFLDASYSPTARTRIYATYSSGLQTAALAQQTLLQSSNFGPGGLQTSSLTGAPLTTTGNAFGTQNSLYRSHLLTVTAVLLRPRDTFSVGLTYEDATVIAGAVGLVTGNSYGGTYGTLTWQHNLSPVTSTNVLLEYGTDMTQVTGTGTPGSNVSEQFYTLSGSLNYAISQTLTSYASYTLSSRFGSAVPGRNYFDNLVLVGLSKGF